MLVVNQAARRKLLKVDVNRAPVPSGNPKLGHGPSFVSDKMVFGGQWNSSSRLEVWVKLLWVVGLRHRGVYWCLGGGRFGQRVTGIHRV